MPEILKAKCFEFTVQILPPPPSLGASRGRERWQNMLTTFYSKLISSLGGENKYELFLSKISTLL